MKPETRASNKERNARNFIKYVAFLLFLAAYIIAWSMNNGGQCVKVFFIVEARRSNEDTEKMWESLVEYIILYGFLEYKRQKALLPFQCCTEFSRDGYYHANEKMYLLKQFIWNLTYQIKIREEDRSLGRENLVQPRHFLLSFLLPFCFPSKSPDGSREVTTQVSKMVKFGSSERSHQAQDLEGDKSGQDKPPRGRYNFLPFGGKEEDGEFVTNFDHQSLS